MPVNLSAGGIRLSLKGPVQSSELFLILLDPGDKKLPICALCEVAWTGNPDQHELVPVGLRFVNILQDDRKRIDNYVREQLKLQGIDVDEARSRVDLLDLMQVEPPYRLWTLNTVKIPNGVDDAKVRGRLLRA